MTARAGATEVTRMGRRTTVSVPWLVVTSGQGAPEQAVWVGWSQKEWFWSVSSEMTGCFLSLYREVEGSFLTRLWARKELSIGLSSGVGWEFFRAE